MSTTEACLAVLDQTSANPLQSTFEDGAGTVYIVEAADCWAEVEAEIENDIAYAQAAVASLEELHLPTDIATEAIENIASGRAYSTDRMIYMAWQWDQNELVDGDIIGLCLYQQSQSAAENAASCWGLEWSQGEYSSLGAYLVKPSSIGSTTSLDDYEPVDASFTLSVEGSWILSSVQTAFESTKRVSAIRFLPSDDNVSSNDPTYDKGVAEVVTYLSSRIDPTTANELFGIEHILQQASDSFTSSAKWTSEQVFLACYNEESCYVPPPPPVDPVEPDEPEDPDTPADPVDDDTEDDTTPEGAIATTVGAFVAATAAMLAF